MTFAEWCYGATEELAYMFAMATTGLLFTLSWFGIL